MPFSISFLFKAHRANPNLCNPHTSYFYPFSFFQAPRYPTEPQRGQRHPADPTIRLLQADQLPLLNTFNHPLFQTNKSLLTETPETSKF